MTPLDETQWWDLDLGGRQWGLQTTGLVRGLWAHALELEIGQWPQ